MPDKCMLRKAMNVFVATLAIGLLPAETEAQTRRESLVVALPSDVATLDPTVNHSLVGFPARLNIFDALTEIGPDGSLKPRLATSWEPSPDAETWTFKLRQGAKFHDGKPVTIDDVIFSFERIMDDPQATPRIYLTIVDKIERVSDDTVRFNLKEPLALWDRHINLIMIVPKEVYQRLGPAQFSLTPVGSGPYKLVRWVKDDRIELEAVSHWSGTPKIKNVTLRPIPAEAARASALLSGEVDIVPNLSPAASRMLSDKPGVQVKTAPGFKVVYIGLNTEHPALADVRMRQAIDYAIDRNTITGRLLRNTADPIGLLVAPVTFGYDAAFGPTAYDPEKARQLVKESGYKGEIIPFPYTNDFIVSGSDVAQAVVGYLNAVGINVQAQPMDYNGFYPLWTARKVPGMHMFIYGGVALDSNTQIMGNFATSGNRGYIFDKRVDELALQQRGTTDVKKRQELISQIWRIASEYVPYVYLYNEKQSYSLRNGISWDAGADSVIRLSDVSIKD